MAGQTRAGKRLRLTIGTDADGIQLGNYLRRQLKFTRAQIKSMKFRENGLLLNGKRARVNELLHCGDELEILLEEEQASSGHLEPGAGKVRILYEDEDLIAVWKDAGLVLHPSHGHYQDTLSNRLHAYFEGRNEPVVIRSIGRLDRDTSGIVVFAKNQVAAGRLWQQKEDGIFWKEYLAVCEGIVLCAEETECAGAFRKANPTDKVPYRQEGGWRTIDAPLDKMAGELMKMCVSEAGRRAVTHYQVLRRMPDRNQTVVRVRIETGRTHQIRVHMASIGHPLAGDVLYGDSEKMAETDGSGLCLCAWKAGFRQPFTGEEIRIDKRGHKA